MVAGTMRYRFAIRVDEDEPEPSARNVFWALYSVRSWRMKYSWPAARSKRETAYGNLRGDIDASTQAEAEWIIRAALEDAKAKRNEVAATGSHVWPDTPWDPMEVTEWPNLTTEVYPAPSETS